MLQYVTLDYSKMSHTTSFRDRSNKFPFSQNSNSKHRLLHQVAHDLNPTNYLWDLVVALDIKFCSHMSLLVADNNIPKYQIAVDIKAHLASLCT